MQKYFRMLLVVLAIQLIVVILELTCFNIEDMTLSNGEIHDFNTNWTIYREDGSSEKITTLPYAADCPANETVIIENVVPKQYWGKTLSFLSADKILKVYMDGVRIYSFGTKDERMFGKTPGSITNFIDLPVNPLKDTGILRIEMVSPYDNYAANISSMIVADRDIAILHLIKTNSFNFILNILILFSSIILAILAVMQKVSKQSTQGMTFLSLYTLLGCIYYFIETKALNVFYGNQTLYSILIFLILMIMPVLLLLYYQQNLLSDFKQRTKFILLLVYANIFLQIILQLSGVTDFMNMAFISHGLIFLTIVVILKSFIDVAKNTEKNVTLEFIALSCMTLGSIIDLVRTYVIKIGDLGKYSRYGTTIFCLMMVIIHGRNVIKSYSSSTAENARLMKRETEITKHQNQLLISAKEEAEAAKQEALNANAAKSNFLANMSHEIRTPINAVLGMDSIILKECQDPKIKEYAMDIRNAGNSLLALINDILDFSKIESGKMEILPVEYELSSLINDCYNLIAMRAKEKDLALYIENDASIPSRLFGDEIRVRQIVTNLLTNAVKYTKQGHVKLRADWKSLDEESMYLILTISDSGIGISEDNQKKLFLSFQRVDEENNRSIEGTGLGLTITKQLLELMNGEIELTSKLGEGSSFCIRIPQKIVNSAPMGVLSGNYMETAAEENIYHINFYAPNGKILVVDDVAMNLKVVLGLLNETGLQIDTVQSGKECLEYVQKNKYHIIFLDHMMPNMDGIETLHEMQKLEHCINRDTPVIMLTANAVLGAREEYLKEGFCDYLTKPIRDSDLEEMIVNYLPDDILSSQESTIEKEPDSESTNQQHPLSTLSRVDVATGLAYCGGSEEFYIEILKTYCEDSKETALAASFSSQDWENYRITVHALKSTSASIGANELSQRAKALEDAAKKQDTSYIEKHHTELLREYHLVIHELESKLKGKDK